MTIAMDARAAFFVADQAGLDESGMLHAAALGRRAAQLDENGMTPPLTLVALVDLPARYAGQEFDLAIELRTPETGEVLRVPDLNGAPGPFRIEQRVRAEVGDLNGIALPDDLGARVQFLLTVPAGVPVTPGLTYRWFLEIDGRHDGAWSIPFFVTA